MTRPSILYVSYDGMLEPLGQSQVLSYLERLSATCDVSLISFEKKTDWATPRRREAAAERIGAAGISWTPLRYHKRPSGIATAFDIAMGTIVTIYILLRHRIRLVHARSYVAALIALAAKRLTGARFLFDMRGFWADERVDMGQWRADSRIYRLAKRLERSYLRNADQVVTLTRASAAEVRRFDYLSDFCPPIAVIPTCADLDRFSGPAARKGPLTIGFVGSATSWSRIDELLAFYARLKGSRPEARLLIVNRDDHAFIRSRIAAAGVAMEDVELVAAEHRDVPALLSSMTVGTALKRPSYSQLACAPTKLAEYLGSGVPVLVNRGIGDVAEIVETERVGIVVDDFSHDALGRAAEATLNLLDDPALAARCRDAACRHFSLEDGVAAYAAIYERLTEGVRNRGVRT